MTFARYPRYKSSGIEWLGEVPSHWEVCAIKRLCVTITDGAHVSPETENGVYRFVSTKDLDGESIDFDNCLLTSARSYESLVRSGCQPHKGDVLFSKDGTVGRTAVIREEREFVVASSLIIMRPDQKALDPEFLHRLSQGDAIRGQVEGFVKGAGLPRLSIQNLLRVIGVFPPLPEQRIIAKILNREIPKIDALVTEQRRLIGLLKEKRQAIISHAVTRGIDPNVPVKDSGIEWLGEVPEHWEVCALRRIASLQSGSAITSNDIEDFGDYPVFGGNGVRGYTNTFIHSGDYVLIGRQGALCGNINYASGSFWPSEHALVVTPLTPIHEFWFGEMLRAMNLNQYSISAAQPGLSVEVLNSLKIPLPPRAEQVAIAAFIKREVSKIDDLILEANVAIVLLQERRTALISAAVTGKIDVRGLADATAEAA